MVALSHCPVTFSDLEGGMFGGASSCERSSLRESRIAVCVDETVPVASAAWHGLVSARALAH